MQYVRIILPAKQFLRENYVEILKYFFLEDSTKKNFCKKNKIKRNTKISFVLHDFFTNVLLVKNVEHLKSIFSHFRQT